ncbi:MAG: choice-of-anchor tandem repeat NxxGxxAF-containing protein [Planctomycetota bacterium]
MNKSGRLVILVFSIVVLLVKATPAGEVVLVEKLRSGDEAPGLEAGVSILDLSILGVDRAGRSILVGQVTGPGIDASNDFCVWRETTEGYEVVLCEGMFAPCVQPTARLAAIRDIKIAPNGAVFFRGILTGSAVSGSNNEGFWYADQEGIRMMARKGDTLVETAGNYVLDELFEFRANSNGVMVFEAVARDPELPGEVFEGIFWSTGSGASAPMPPGSITTVFGEEAVVTAQRDPYITDEDVINFRLSAEGIDSSRLRVGIVTSSELDFILNYEAGGMIDLGESDLFYSTISSNLLLRSLASNGHLTFTNTAFSSDNQGEPEEILILQETATGLRQVFDIPFVRVATEGRELTSLSFPESNSSGDAVFLGFSDRSETPFIDNERSVWLADAEGARSLADVGQLAVGFDSTRTYSDFDFPAINPLGQALFSGSAIDPGNPQNSERAVWATDPVGQVYLVAGTGQLINTSKHPQGSDFKQVSSVSRVSRGNGEDGDGISFSPDGSIPLTIGFEDGTTIAYVARVQPGCSPQDLALPHGKLDFFDLLVALPSIDTAGQLDAFQAGIEEGCTR